MKFSYSSVWDETVRTLRTNSSLLLAVAGVFLFLPALATAYLAPPPQAGGPGSMIGYYRDNVWLLLGAQIIAFIGNLAILALVLDPRRPTVGGSIKGAFAMLPAYFLVSLLSGLMILFGLALLIVPGLYLIGRLTAAGPALVVEGRRNPFDLIRRSFEVTKGNGWAILGLILLVFIAFYILMLAITFVFGAVFLVMDRMTGGGIGALLLLILGAGVGAAFNTVLMVLVASIYRRLSAAGQATVPPSRGI